MNWLVVNLVSWLLFFFGAAFPILIVLKAIGLTGFMKVTRFESYHTFYYRMNPSVKIMLGIVVTVVAAMTIWWIGAIMTVIVLLSYFTLKDGKRKFITGFFLTMITIIGTTWAFAPYTPYTILQGAFHTSKITGIWSIFWKKRRFLHGAINLLRLCSDFGVPVAIITNGNPQIQFRTMIRLKLHDYVDVLLTPGNADEMKPSNTLFERAMEIFDVNPERVIMVGDSFSHDVIGAVNAGIIPVWLNNLQMEKTKDVNLVEIASFTELIDKLQFRSDNE